MHATASYHNALSYLPQTQHRTSDQHKELGQSQKLRDFNGLQKLITWFQYHSHSRFNPDRHQLQTLESGLIADESVICDEAEYVARSIQDSLDGVSLKEAAAKLSVQASTLSSLKPSVKIGNEKVVIDPMILVSRLVVLLQRHDDITRFFGYELTVVPMSLFKSNMMRKPSKSALAKALDQRQEKDASKPDGSFSMESKNEFDDDKEESYSDTEENIFEVLEDTGINKKGTTSDTSYITLLMVVIFYIE